jgi:hypothetical protein
MSDHASVDPVVQHGKQPLGDPVVQHGKQPAPKPPVVDEDAPEDGDQ